MAAKTSSKTQPNTTKTNGAPPAAAQPAPAGQSHNEAPASASAKMISPRGVEWLLTARDETVNGLMQKIDVMESHLLDHGWTPAGARYAPPAPAANGAAAQVANCPVHGTPMKSSQFGGLYCPAKNPDGSYCKEKIKA